MLNGLRRKHINEETLRFAQSDKDFLDSPGPDQQERRWAHGCKNIHS